jgi:hypothetical protein
MTFGDVCRTFAAFHTPLWRIAAVIGLMLGLVGAACAATPDTDNADIGYRRSTERRSFTDAEILDGFFKVTFGAEFHVAGGVDRIRKYDGPIKVFIDNRATPDRTPQVEAAIADIRSRIRNIDIARIDRREDANMIVSLVNDRDLSRMIRTIYGIDRARRIQRTLEPQCLSGFRKDESSRILRSDVIITADVGEFVFYDCVYEELLQALGPINDDTTVPWTMFNDDVQMGFFDLYDQYLLNILYDPRVQPGMTRTEVQALIPVVLPEVRAWVEDNNKGP